MQALFKEKDPSSHSNSSELVHLIKEEIALDGAITFSRFMELALYHPIHGYYQNRYDKIGKMGDYITAPEISPLYAYCLAKQCQQILENISNGAILELGAGNGTLAVNILLSLETGQSLPETYYILDVSTDFKVKQKELFSQKIPHLLHRIVWLDQLPEKKFNGIIIANEVLDAFPVHKFVIKNGFKENYVAIYDDNFIWETSEPSLELKKFAGLFENLDENYESEINTLIYPWINSLQNCLQEGLILLIDYGFPRAEYYHVDRNKGTLMCHYQHRAHSDPLKLIGLQDITCHVDFTAVAEAAQKFNLDTAGYTTQANFLLSCGILDFVENSGDLVSSVVMNQGIKKLLMPEEMGELFKVLAITKQVEKPLIGFQRRDLRDRL